MKILATDLDRTLLPNGLENDDGTLPLLTKLVKECGIAVVYVTARRINSVLGSVMKQYNPPRPKYIIGAVGAEMYELIPETPDTYRELNHGRSTSLRMLTSGTGI